MRWLSAIFIALVAFNVDAQSKNTWQELQPGGSNYVARSQGPFTYGYPACGDCPVEPNVVAQWIFDESSGDVVDEVSSLTVPQRGSPVYSVDTESYSPNMLLGITGNIAAGYFDKITDSPGIAPGTGDFTVEMVLAIAVGDNSGDRRVFSTWDATGGTYNGTFVFITNAHTGNVARAQIWAEGTSGSTLNAYLYGSENIADGVFRKHRIVADRDGHVSWYMNGRFQGSATMANVQGETIPARNLSILGTPNAGGYACPWTLTELRLSNNATNNSGGKNGG